MKKIKKAQTGANVSKVREDMTKWYNERKNKVDSIQPHEISHKISKPDSLYSRDPNEIRANNMVKKYSQRPVMKRGGKMKK